MSPWMSKVDPSRVDMWRVSISRRGAMIYLFVEEKEFVTVLALTDYNNLLFY